jgi:glucose-1-phosphate cytidylyltransferase
LEPWTITLLDTGPETQTGGRLLRAKDHIGHETFSFTYGDGVTDLDFRKVIAFHEHAGAIATVTAVLPPARYGRLTFEDDLIHHGDRVRFNEKPPDAAGWVSGGYFVAEPSILDYIDDDDTIFEHAPLERLSSDGELAAYKHYGYWHGMDTLWDKIVLNGLWTNGKAPWKTWSD